MPPPPMKPMSLNLSIYPDPATQDLLRREHDRQMKAYEQVLADREATLNDRKELENCLRRLAIQELKKSREPIKQDFKQSKEPKGKENATESAKESPPAYTPSPETTPMLGPMSPVDPMPMLEDATELTPSAKNATAAHTEEKSPSPDPPTPTTDLEHTTSLSSNIVLDREESRSLAPESTKPKKDRKFCALPKKNEFGERDPLWVRVFMEDHDEVSAHTGLFYTSGTYERLVGEVGAKIEEWVRDDMTRRMVEEWQE